jgi:hypothetical protein
MEYIAFIYVVGAFVAAFLCGKNNIKGDTTVLMVAFWPLIILTFPFMWIYDRGKEL